MNCGTPNIASTPNLEAKYGVGQLGKAEWKLQKWTNVPQECGPYEALLTASST
jgi:hypothetical protein